MSPFTHTHSLLPFVALILFSVFFPVFIDSAYYEGPFPYHTQWAFLQKFCFSDDFGGNGTLQFSAVTPSKSLKLLIYRGSGGTWDSAYLNHLSLSCQQLVNLTGNTGAIIDVSTGQINITIHQIAHAYFWFIALADCEAGGIKVDSYTLHFINPGGVWFEEFSYDEQGVAQYYLFFLLAYILLVLVHLWTVWTLMQMESWHPIVRILTAAIALQFLATISETIHYMVYLRDGVGSSGLKAIGEFLTMGAQLIIMLLTILVAKGWTITTNILANRRTIIVSGAIFFLAYLGLFIWDFVGRDPASTLYLYESIPGIIICVLRVLMTGWFLYCLRETIGVEAVPDKKRFYFIFGFFFTVWFLLLPAIVIFSLVLEPYYRFRTVRGMLLSADFLAYVAYIVFFWPTRVISYFNIKTTPTLMSNEYPSNTYGTDTSL